MSLVKDQCRLNIRKYSFSQRTINEWKRFSTDCVNVSSVNMLKNKFEKYLRRAGGRLHINEKLLDPRQANGFLVHLSSGPLPWMAILLNLVKCDVDAATICDYR